MKYSLTVAYITSRREPRISWFMDTLGKQVSPADCKVIVVSPWLKEARNSNVRIANPKPTVWQGPHRLTKADWWAASNSRNTAICLCETDWLAFVDDRLALGPNWLAAVVDAMEGNYAVCGPYEKVHNLVVENGLVTGYKELFDSNGYPTGKDNRLFYCQDHYYHHKHLLNPFKAPGEWWYGCSTATPLEWALQINGYDESCDGLSGEDYIFGLMLKNNGFEIRYDTRMNVIEDRTPGTLDPVMIRRDKGVSPNDKSHWLVDKLKGQRRAMHPGDLRQIRACALAGKGWPVIGWPNRDLYDGQPLSEMEPG